MTSAELKRRRERRRRVSRIRNTIVLVFAGLMVFLLAAFLILTVMVFRLNSKVKLLNQKVSSIETALIAKSESGDTEVYMGGIVSSDAEESDVGSDESESSDAEETGYGISEHQNIYLTFDDGPSSYTGEILDILDEYGVKATFFVIGTEDEDLRAMYKEIYDRGHTLAMHSYTHKYSSLYESLDSFKAEIKKERKLLYKITGEEPWLFRFPGGSSNEVSNVDMSELISWLNDEGITYFDWNVIGADATSQIYTSQDVVDSVMNDISKFHTAVVLLHDTNAKGATVEALDDLLDLLIQRDADILPITKDTPLIQMVSSDSVN